MRTATRSDASRGFVGRLAGAVALAAATAAWMNPAWAVSGCRNDQDKKVCVTMTVSPSDTIAPSRMGSDSNRTYEKITATLQNVGQTSTRYVTMQISLDPATGYKANELVAPAPLSCTISGAVLSCQADKLLVGQSLTLTVPAEAPLYQGASTAAQFVTTDTFGWQGNTTTISTTVPVSSTSGSTYVPANTSPTLYTSPPTANPEDQVTVDHPLWGSVTLPPQPAGYYAKVYINLVGPAFLCPTGVFLTAQDGGPYLCRDQAEPGRWFEVDLGATFTAVDPIFFTMQWHQTLVQAIQLAPTAAAPTGTPPWAIFYDQDVGQATTSGRAFAATCGGGTPAPPCLTTVQQFGNGNWTASGYKTNDGTDLAMMKSPLAPLLAVLDYVVGIAEAQILQAPSIMR